jgi:adenylylsulfate kinase-like enzyme
VYVNASLKYCAKHDDKGLYEAAQEGSLKDLSGVNAPYEKPSRPWATYSPEKESKEDCAARILAALKKEGQI